MTELLLEWRGVSLGRLIPLCVIQRAGWSACFAQCLITKSTLNVTSSQECHPGRLIPLCVIQRAGWLPYFAQCLIAKRKTEIRHFAPSHCHSSNCLSIRIFVPFRSRYHAFPAPAPVRRPGFDLFYAGGRDAGMGRAEKIDHAGHARFMVGHARSE
jgi:hypothetical protein